jgi:hypothetical protein
MKGRRIKVYTSRTLLNCWRQMLGHLNQIKARGFDDLDPSAVAEITCFVRDNIDRYRPANARPCRRKMLSNREQFATLDNAADNGFNPGEDNGG